MGNDIWWSYAIIGEVDGKSKNFGQLRDLGKSYFSAENPDFRVFPRKMELLPRKKSQLPQVGGPQPSVGIRQRGPYEVENMVGRHRRAGTLLFRETLISADFRGIPRKRGKFGVPRASPDFRGKWELEVSSFLPCGDICEPVGFRMAGL